MKTTEPYLLIIETSGRVGQLALARGADIRGARTLSEARRHARDLAPAVADLLRGEQLRPAGLHGIIVGRGPGSYTGLRVGIMSAKTLAYATSCPVIAIDTFAAIADQLPLEALTADVLADAQQEKVYWQRFTRPAAGSNFQPASPLAIVKLADWLAQREEHVWITGPALSLYKDRLPRGSQMASPELWDPKPHSLLRIGLARYQRGEFDDFWTLEPLYARPSSAEEKWQNR